MRIANSPDRHLQAQCRHYDVVARAIEYLRHHMVAQPTLQDVAGAVGLSPHHLQRVFTQWAGISPKRFLQHLSLLTVRQRLQACDDVMTAADAAGLSGGSRVHDLTVTCEAVTPGQIRDGGLGLEIIYGCGPTPFGSAFVGMTARGVCHLEFTADRRDRLTRALRDRWPAAGLVHDGAAAQHMLGRIFAGASPTAAPAPLHLLLRGTNFQIQVWSALMRTTPGERLSYSALARRAGARGAARAVGSAMAANAIAWLIPCHRVIREGGVISQYRWGVERKMAMLAWEGAACERRLAAGAD